MTTKITYFGADYPPTGGGIATFANSWLDSISSMESVGKVGAIIFGNLQPRKERVKDNFDIQTYKTKNFFTIGYLVAIQMFLKRDSALFHSLNIFPVGFWTVFFSKIFFKKSAITFYGTDVCATNASRLTKILKKWTIEHCDFAFTISNFTKNETRDRLQIRREIEVIYPPMPLSYLNSKKGDSVNLSKIMNESDFMILSVCRMVERKGLGLLIKAMALIENKDIKLVLVGDGKERSKLEGLVKEKSLADRIMFVGKVNDLRPYYLRADVAVLLSYYIREEGDFEGLGLVLLEAEYFGVPVIGSKSGGIGEAFVDGRTGILVRENNVEDIRNAIMRLYDDATLREKMSNESKRFIFERFDPNKQMTEYLKVII